MGVPPGQRPESSQPPSSPPSPEKRRSGWKAKAIFGLLAALAIFAALTQGIQRINLVSGEIEFRDGAATSGEITRSDLESAQPELEQRIAEAEAEAASQSEVQPASEEASDFSGQWTGQAGYSYVITQYGDQVFVQEIYQGWVSAVAQGTVAGDGTASLRFQAADGSTGSGVLIPAGDNAVEARFTNHTYGTSSTMVLTR